ncbi:MAG: acyltransferase [Lachnospiraceae bacterium]|nr:acyltransferase [Lachnospiraceae bacterium]
MKKRVVSIELLRILAMMMVVMLHYLGKGELLPGLLEDMPHNGYVAWGLESLSIVAVNVYMLISGYFLVNAEFKPARLIELLCQVLFYTLLVPVVLAVPGVISLKDFTMYDLLLNVLPVQMIQYWFITAYVIMYLFSPVLATAAKHMKQEQLRNTIIILLLFFSVSKSILPVALEVDNAGYDGLWFICVFLTAAYIRLYGIPFFSRKKSVVKGVLCYLAGCVGIFGITMLIHAVYLKTGSLDHFVKEAFEYNHILNLFAAVALFYAFLNMELSTEGVLAKLVYAVAPCSLGVYLLHEQLQVRYLWPKWLGASLEGNAVVFVLRCVLAVVIVFVVGVLVDAFRRALFGVAVKVFKSIKGTR